MEELQQDQRHSNGYLGWRFFVFFFEELAPPQTKVVNFRNNFQPFINIIEGRCYY
jgi:hypothetical protein